SQFGVFDFRPRDLQRAFDRVFQSRIKDQRHTVAGRNFSQLSGRFLPAKRAGVANDSVECVQQRALLVDQTLRESNDVNEEDMCQLQLGVFRCLAGHMFTQKGASLDQYEGVVAFSAGTSTERAPPQYDFSLIY